MTRETKIGLLVGLAFIIVIGILLSDYNRNEIQGAPLPLVANNISSSTATLHNRSNESEIVLPPAPTIPARPVLTPQDLHRETQIVITPGPGPVTARADERDPVRSVSPVTPDAPPADPATGAHTSVTPEPVGPTNIPETVAVGPQAAAPHDPVAASQTVNGARQYVAVASDTVNKLAGRFMGGNTKANREAILAINPSLKANPNNVVVGHTYMIPAVKPAAASATWAPALLAPPVTAAPAPARAPATTDGPHYYYTVKENDNLWKIAAEQLGDGSAWAAIKELNKDVLKGGENLRPNMRLRLPAKPVASAE